MKTSVKDLNIKNCTYYFFDDINTKDFNSNNIKIDEKSNKNIPIYYIAYATIKNLKYVLTLGPTNQSKEKIKKYEEMWIKIKDLIRLVTKKSDYCDDKCMKIKLDSDDKLPANKTIEIPVMVIVVRAFFMKITNIF